MFEGNLHARVRAGEAPWPSVWPPGPPAIQVLRDEAAIRAFELAPYMESRPHVSETGHFRKAHALKKARAALFALFLYSSVKFRNCEFKFRGPPLC